METKSWMYFKATLVVLVLGCRGLTVDPPEEIAIVDPGHLGYLEIKWSPPSSLINLTECSKLYQLEYFNTYKSGWSAVRTPKMKYSAQFDLMKDVRVRVYTLLSGPCTNGTLVKSTNYTELVQKPPNAGVEGTAVQNLVCVYYNMKYMLCKWERGPKTPAKAQHHLYYWYKELGQAQECPKYILSNGCNFTGTSLPDFKDINFCVNGSSPEGPLKPTYTSLQIQNQVKPETTDKLQLQTGPDSQLELQWDRPAGRIPGHCLEWELEHTREGPDGKVESELISTAQMSLTLAASHNDIRNCFRVRSKLHKYCASKGFWSEWGRQACYPVRTEVMPKPEWDILPVYMYVAVTIIATLVLSLCVWVVLNVSLCSMFSVVHTMVPNSKVTTFQPITGGSQEARKSQTLCFLAYLSGIQSFRDGMCDSNTPKHCDL